MSSWTKFGWVSVKNWVLAKNWVFLGIQFLAKRTKKAWWHDIILTIMSHCDQPIAFCNHFYAPKLCFFNLSDILGWYVFEKMIPLTWKFSLLEPHHRTLAYGSHICQILSKHWSNEPIFIKKINVIIVSNNFGNDYRKYISLEQFWK